MLLRVRHLVRLLIDIGRFGAVTGSFWMLPAVLFLLMLALLVVTTHTAVPYVVYTFF